MASAGSGIWQPVKAAYRVAEWLLEQGADVNVMDRFKRTPTEVIFYRFFQLESIPKF